ncbi:phage tail assembly protein [Pseudomonas sp. WS 5079]|uniref:phage tail assembly protein n=1 Tax=Pseudomonas sp. WS 5079 TaxID=2717492 RepID=UPI001552BBA5|nr:phage tail assembly protein [Pseudomonas sp. WS 5079]
MAEVLSLPLKFPFTSAAGVLISSLPINRLKRKDVSAAQSGTNDQNLQEDMLAAKMLGITLEDLGEFDIADAKSVTDLMNAMMNGKNLADVLAKIIANIGTAAPAPPADVFRDGVAEKEPDGFLGRSAPHGPSDATI